MSITKCPNKKGIQSPYDRVNGFHSCNNCVTIPKYSYPYRFKLMC